MSEEFLSYFEELGRILKRIFYIFMFSFLFFIASPSPEITKKFSENPLSYDLFVFWIIREAQKAYLPEGFKIYAPSIVSPLLIMIQIAFFLSLIVTIPYAVFSLYSFIAPALYPHEKKIFKKYAMPFGILYVSGLVYTIIFILPLTFKISFLLYTPLGIELLININDFVNLLVFIPILGGLLFCLPIFLLPLMEIGVLSVATLKKNRILIYLIIAFIIGLISPDPTFISVIPLLIPIYILYEVSILIGKRKRNV
jgi:Sec-independent protein secretion pathway component TatC